jgi:hypothetical protein
MTTPQLSSSGLSRGPTDLPAPRLEDGWMVGTSPTMTHRTDRIRDELSGSGAPQTRDLHTHGEDPGQPRLLPFTLKHWLRRARLPGRRVEGAFDTRNVEAVASREVRASGATEVKR